MRTVYVPTGSPAPLATAARGMCTLPITMPSMARPRMAFITRLFALFDMALTLQSHNEHGPTIQAACFFTFVVVLRPFFAVADGAQPRGRDTLRRQVIAHHI